MNNNFSNFKPIGTSVVGIQEWTAFENQLNQKLNLLHKEVTNKTMVVSGIVSIGPTFSSFPANPSIATFWYAEDTGAMYYFSGVNGYIKILGQIQ